MQFETIVGNTWDENLLRTVCPNQISNAQRPFLPSGMSGWAQEIHYGFAETRILPIALRQIVR